VKILYRNHVCLPFELTYCNVSVAIILLFLHSIPEHKVGCYYCRFQKENLLEMATLESDISAPEYVVCFLGGSEKGLELYPYL